MLTRPPEKKSRTYKSVTLEWLPWTRPPDLGEGPVSGYRVYYTRQLGSTQWEQMESTEELQMVVRGLMARTNYQFKVAPLHEQGFEGRPSPVATVVTCGGKCCIVLKSV